MKDIIEQALPDATVISKGKDLVVKSKNREQSKKDLEKFFNSRAIEYASVLTYKSSLEVLRVPLLKGDILFKPIIAKGQGGRDFEDAVANDLKNFFAGAENQDFKHPDVIEALAKELKLEPRLNGTVKSVGRMQNKRSLDYSLYGFGLGIKNNDGPTIADLIVTQNNKTHYLSLKYGKTYYALNGSIGKYFLDKRTNKSINEYFGFDGMLMGGFGPEYAVVTEPPNYLYAQYKLENVLSQSMGNDLVIVHKKSTNDVYVKYIRVADVSVSGLKESSYVYPLLNRRKYANIKVQARIEGVSYIANFQFRGTSGSDKGPKYLRLLLERK